MAETSKMNMDPIKCEICGAETHAISKHLDTSHPEMKIEEYQKTYPDAPLLSPIAEAKVKERIAARASVSNGYRFTKKTLAEAFNFPSGTKGVVSTKTGKPIMVSVYDESPKNYAEFVPERDPNYIFQVDTLKTVLLGFERKLNVYLVGHAGTGKSTLIEQVCAVTKRSMIRVQHTVNMEESHVLGQYVVKANKKERVVVGADGSPRTVEEVVSETEWQPGPLAIAMRFGMVYLADEYDRAMPQVLSVYQPVLEGKSLVTKEAPPEWRVIKPHPDFRICGTGNTNGSGDETGLYPSTALQDFANYDRFAMMIEIDWMPRKQEIAVISSQCDCSIEHAEVMVDFATEIRKEFAAGKLGAPIGPRALINAGRIGVGVGDFRRGLDLAFGAKLNQRDREVVNQVGQRIFGS